MKAGHHFSRKKQELFLRTLCWAVFMGNLSAIQDRSYYNQISRGKVGVVIDTDERNKTPAP